MECTATGGCGGSSGGSGDTEGGCGDTAGGSGWSDGGYQRCYSGGDGGYYKDIVVGMVAENMGKDILMELIKSITVNMRNQTVMMEYIYMQ